MSRDDKRISGKQWNRNPGKSKQQSRDFNKKPPYKRNRLVSQNFSQEEELHDQSETDEDWNDSHMDQDSDNE